MAYELDSVRGVKSRYDQVDLRQGEDRSLATDGSIFEKTVMISGDDYGSVSFTMPAGSVVLDSYVDVEEAFVLGGTTPTVILGTDASNHIAEVAEADAEAVGKYLGVVQGTYASPLASDTVVSVSLGGTTPTITAAGKMKVTFRYKK